MKNFLITTFILVSFVGSGLCVVSSDPTVQDSSIVSVSASKILAGDRDNIGSLTVDSATVTGSNFSVGGSTLVVSGGNVRIGNPIGTPHSSSKLNIYSGSFQFISGNTAIQYIFFGDTDSATTGYISYNHSTNLMKFISGDSEVINMTATSVVLGYTEGSNVGIGKTPAYNLDVANTANFDKGILTSTITVTSSGIDLVANNEGIHTHLTGGQINKTLWMNDNNNLQLNNSYSNIQFQFPEGKGVGIRKLPVAPYGLDVADTANFDKGILSSTGTFTGMLNVSSITATGGMYPASAASLPTTGYNAGSFLFNTADYRMYYSTETVVGVESWKGPL